MTQSFNPLPNKISSNLSHIINCWSNYFANLYTLSYDRNFDDKFKKIVDDKVGSSLQNNKKCSKL